MKRQLPVFQMLKALVLICIIGLSASAQASETLIAGGSCGVTGGGVFSDSVKWSLNSEGLLYIWGEGNMGGEAASSYENGASYSYVMPWSEHKDSILSVKIAEGVAGIGSKAFAGCVCLSSVELPSTLETIDASAFYDCQSLTSLAIPASVTSIGGSAFADSGLTSVVLPQGLACIETSLFANSKIQTLTLPSGVIRIEPRAFDHCTELISVVLPDGLRALGEYAFHSCAKLESITLPSSLTTLGQGAFMYCGSLTEAVVSAQLSRLPLYSFLECTSLKKVVLPASLAELDETVFEQCTALEKIHFQGDAPAVDAADTLHNGFNGGQVPALYKDVVTLYYPSGAAGWSTPLWNGYKCLPEVELAPTPTPTPGAELPPEATPTPTSRPCTHVDALGYPLYAQVLETWREYPCFGTAESCYIVEYDSYVCSGCGQTATWHSDWYDDHSFGADGVCSICGYKADGTFVGTGATPTPTVTPTPAPTVPKAETAKTLDDLTDVDYLAFSALAYEDAQRNLTVEQLLRKLNKWDALWENKDFYHRDLYAHIKDWYVYDFSQDVRTGFSATVFASPHSYDVVIAYRGSIPFDTIEMNWNDIRDAVNDWILNDIPPIACDIEPFNSQYDNAIELYENTRASRFANEIAVTGHSLGGGLANTVSAYSGSRGVAFNGVAILDILYFNHYDEMSPHFAGINKWNFVDHVNVHDVLAGAWQVNQKNALIHQSMESRYADLIENFVNHSLHSMVWRDEEGNIRLTSGRKQSASAYARYLGCSDEESLFTQALQDTINFIAANDRMLFLGSSRRNAYELADSVVFGNYLCYTIPLVALGGDGDDQLTGGKDSDVLIGGRDNDVLDGRWNDDVYYYRKGDGEDIITDLTGRDTLYLQDIDPDSTIRVVSEPAQLIRREYSIEDFDFSSYTVSFEQPPAGDVLEDDYEFVPSQTTIYCNQQPLVRIVGSRSNNGSNLFTLIIERADGKRETRTIQFNQNTVEVARHYELHCPIDVDILDADGHVVYTLYDNQPGAYYTVYGNFYVTPLENSAHCAKTLDLFKGYSMRIRGIADGVMSLAAYDTDGFTLSAPVGVQNVSVTSDAIAQVVTHPETGEPVLAIDQDGNGSTDLHIPLVPLHDGELTKVDAVFPTCGTPGSREYYTCSCGKAFFDPDGQYEIADLNSVVLSATGLHTRAGNRCAVCGAALPPQTGDSAPLGALVLLSAAGLLGIVTLRKRFKV